MQLTHYDSKFEVRSFPVVIICDGLSSPFNIGGIFRLADAFGVERLVFLNSGNELGKRFKRTSRSAEKYVSHSFEDNFTQVYDNLEQQGYQFLALEITEDSKAINQLSINSNQPVALVVGSENFGISDDVLNRIKTHVHITMYGINSSMNVVQSAAIALYEISNQLK